jgi:hypothetical protein
MDRTVDVEPEHGSQQIAFLLGELHEFVEIAEGIEHDIQAGQAAKADHKHGAELPQQVTVDDPHALVS